VSGRKGESVCGSMKHRMQTVQNVARAPLQLDTFFKYFGESQGLLSIPIFVERLIMAENVPPGSAAKVSITTDSTARGLPYYEKLRRDLRDTIQKKRILDKNIVCFSL
jgi:hypothetical protein